MKKEIKDIDLSVLNFKETLLTYYSNKNYYEENVEIRKDNAFKDLLNKKTMPIRLEQINRNFESMSDEQKLQLFEVSRNVFFKVAQSYYHKKLSRNFEDMSDEQKHEINELYPQIYKAAAQNRLQKERDNNVKRLHSLIDNLQSHEIINESLAYIKENYLQKYIKHCLENQHESELLKYVDDNLSFYIKCYTENRTKIENSHQINFSEAIEKKILEKNSNLIFYSMKGVEYQKNFLRSCGSRIDLDYFLNNYTALKCIVGDEMKAYMFSTYVGVLKKMQYTYENLRALSVLFIKNLDIINEIDKIDTKVTQKILSTSMDYKNEIESWASINLMQMTYINCSNPEKFISEIINTQLLYNTIKVNKKNWHHMVTPEEYLFNEDKRRHLKSLDIKCLKNEEVYVSNLFNIYKYGTKSLITQNPDYLSGQLSIFDSITPNMIVYLLKNLELPEELNIYINKMLLSEKIEDKEKKVNTFKI